jgi:hypothetical protein
MIKLHDQDQEFLNTCRNLDGKMGMILFISARDNRSDLEFLLDISEIQKLVSRRTGLDLILFPVIGSIPDHTLRAGLKYALKIVSVDEELVKKVPL